MAPSAVDGRCAAAAAFVAAAPALPTGRPAVAAPAAPPAWAGRRPAVVPAVAPPPPAGRRVRQTAPPPICAKKQPPSSRAKAAASAASPPPPPAPAAAAAAPPPSPPAAADAAAAPAAATSSTSTPTAELAARLLALTRPVNCGYSFIEGDPAPVEYDIDDVVAALEAAAEASPPEASSPDLVGTWRLVYTTSPAVRYVGGLTGAQGLLPGGGRSVSVVRVVDEPDEPTCTMVEELAWTPPWGGGGGGGGGGDGVAAGERPLTVSVTGSLRRGGSGWNGISGGGVGRMVWSPERLALGWIRPWGDSWKSLRPWTVMDVSWVGDGVQVSRGQTGYVFVWEKVEEA